MQAPQGRREVGQETREVDVREILGERPRVGGAEEIARLDGLRQVAADVEGGPPRLRGLDDEDGIGGADAGGGEVVGGAPAPGRLAATQADARPLGEAALPELLDDDVDRPRAGREAGQVEIIAAPVEGREGGPGVDEAPQLAFQIS